MKIFKVAILATCFVSTQLFAEPEGESVLTEEIRTSVLEKSEDNTSPDLADQKPKEIPAAYYDDKSRGWFWYEQKKPVSVKKKKNKPTASTPPAPVDTKPVLSNREILKKQGEFYDEAIATAILHPSLENYRKYMAIAQQILQQSEDFASGVQKATRITAEFDYGLQKPQSIGSALGYQQNEIETSQKNAYLNSLSKSNALIFVFRSDCPYCHRFAPIIKRFANDYGFNVQALSMDGAGLPEYPSPRVNQALIRKLSVQAVPAVYLLDPKLSKVTTVGFGATSYGELGERIIDADKRGQESGAMNQ